MLMYPFALLAFVVLQSIFAKDLYLLPKFTTQLASPRTDIFCLGMPILQDHDDIHYWTRRYRDPRLSSFRASWAVDKPASKRQLTFRTHFEALFLICTAKILNGRFAPFYD